MRLKPSMPKYEGMFCQRLDELVNLKHPLALLAHHIDSPIFEREWTGFFPSKHGRQTTSPRLVAGLLYLQHTLGLSDEAVVWGRERILTGSYFVMKSGSNMNRPSIPVH